SPATVARGSPGARTTARSWPSAWSRRRSWCSDSTARRSSRPDRSNSAQGRPGSAPPSHSVEPGLISRWNGCCAPPSIPGMAFSPLRSEEAFRLELAALILAVPVAFLVAEDAWKRLALIAVVAFVLVVELLNTAIEKLADRVNLAIDPQIGRVKDMGSAAVGLALLI